MDLSLNTEIEFRSLAINISCIIEKDNKHYPEIYLHAVKSIFSEDLFTTKKNLFSLRKI